MPITANTLFVVCQICASNFSTANQKQIRVLATISSDFLGGANQSEPTASHDRFKRQPQSLLGQQDFSGKRR
jgi:hypothetical protein